jgi:glycosyltransferase involved in cell wall biosynthesis
MNHLIVCREFPPFPYPPGGIGTYVSHISRLLAQHGDTVHVVAQMWPGEPHARASELGGRLVIHRVPLDEPLAAAPRSDAAVLRRFQRSPVPVQAFAWQVARLAESLLDEAAIDIIEAQEYEAPLYYLLRRRRDHSPALRPVPAVVHLHTPSEFLYAQNGWDLEGSDCRLLARLEASTIMGADALLCPSRFLARIAETRYGLAEGQVRVWPYPMGDTAVIERDDTTWAEGHVCYVGRLEVRKGVQEWIDAAGTVAGEDGAVRFSLIGGDPVYWGGGGHSIRQDLEARIPEPVRGRVTFVDPVPRPQLVQYLARARVGVVPSRWENFPNTCIEAMASGLPVLVSPTGGMSEMVRDGVTGWVAERQDADALADALWRALRTSPADLARMGAAAAVSIRELCGNDRVVRGQLEFKRAVVSAARRTREASAPAASAAHLRALDAEIDALQHADVPPAMLQSAHTMTPLDVLRAGPTQQLAALRRAFANPRYVSQWLAWHGRRALGRLSRR